MNLRVTGLCKGNSPVTGPVAQKMFPFDDVIMVCEMEAINDLSYFSYCLRQCRERIKKTDILKIYVTL